MSQFQAASLSLENVPERQAGQKQLQADWFIQSCVALHAGPWLKVEPERWIMELILEVLAAVPEHV